MKRYLRRLKNRYIGHKKTQKDVIVRIICQSFGDNRAERRAGYPSLWKWNRYY